MSAAKPARPFLKWAGGKGGLLDAIEPHLPARFGRYYEPFVGGGSLFFRLRERRAFPAFLSDANAELIDTYRAVRDHVEQLIESVGNYEMQHKLMGADWYYRVRDRRVRSPWIADRAARTIYLNKTCFNGLYRVNRAGKFNVPVGRYANPKICDAANLRACSRALQGVDLATLDLSAALCLPMPGDLVYLDPPYDGTFTDYTAGGFGDAQQEYLADTFRELAGKGVYMLASNADTPRIRELYQGFKIVELRRGGGMNSDPTKRGKVKELLIVGWQS